MNQAQHPPVEPDLSSEPLSPPPMGDAAVEPQSPPKSPSKSPSDNGDDNEEDQTRAGN